MSHWALLTIGKLELLQELWGQDMPVGWQQLSHDSEQFMLFSLFNPAQFTLCCLKPRVN